jgi:hypothetical protein
MSYTLPSLFSKKSTPYFMLNSCSKRQNTEGPPFSLKWKIITLFIFTFSIFTAKAQAPDFQKMTPEGRTAYQAKIKAASEEDHKKMLALLNIKTLRQGANGSNPQAPNAANYDEAEANPFPILPDALVLKNGKQVTSAKVWWTKRRPEIVEDFDREIYGRVPSNTPSVKWEITSQTQDTVGEMLVNVKKLIGHVDNSSYPQIKVDIQLTLTTPTQATKTVPVIMEFGFGARPPQAPNAPLSKDPTWQQQLLAKGWGYAIIIPNSIQADNGAGLTQGIIGLMNKGQDRKPDDWGSLRAWAWAQAVPWIILKPTKQSMPSK